MKLFGSKDIQFWLVKSNECSALRRSALQIGRRSWTCLQGRDRNVGFERGFFDVQLKSRHRSLIE